MTAFAMPYPPVPELVPAPQRPRGVFAAAYLLAGAAAFWLAAMAATMCCGATTTAQSPIGSAK